MDLMTFEKAMADARTFPGDRSVLLGNGFSIDHSPDAFRYDRLLTGATLDGLHVDRDTLFEALATDDFECVVERLSAAADLVDLYTDGKRRGLRRKLRRDAEIVRYGLVDALADKHPESARTLADDEARRARTFLSHFCNVFTTNYDMLLYWTVMRGGDGTVVPQNDGFGKRDPDGLEWSIDRAAQQHIFYLHGALHLFMRGGRLEKLSNRGTTLPRAHKTLLSQVQTMIDDGDFPFIVTEGKSSQKVARIAASDYLRSCHEALRNASGTLFIHGLSLSQNDDHIAALIEDPTSTIERVYVGVHGDPRDLPATEVRNRANLLAKRRSKAGGTPLEVNFYDSATAHVWRRAAQQEANATKATHRMPVDHRPTPVGSGQPDRIG